MKIARKGLVVAIVVFSFLATVLCTGRWVNVSKKQLRQLKKAASDPQQPLEEQDDLDMENRQGESRAAWSNTKLQSQIQALELKVNSIDTALSYMKPDYRGYEIFLNDELFAEYDVFSMEEIKKVNIFSRLIRTFNFFVWGDV